MHDDGQTSTNLSAFKRYHHHLLIWLTRVVAKYNQNCLEDIMIDVNMRECIFESMLMGFACDCGGLFYKGPIKRKNCCGCPDEILKE